MLKIQLASGLANPDDPQSVRDDLLQSDSAGGVRWLAHLDFDYCYPGTSPVPGGAVVKNMVDGQPHARVVVPVGASGPALTNGALDFGSADTAGTYLEMPVEVSNAIAAAGQQFLICAYLRLPAEADWAELGGQANTILNFTDTGSYSQNPDILAVRLATNGGVAQLLFNRQTDVGAAEQLSFSPIPAEAFGAVCQIAFWRDDTTQYASIRTPAGRETRQSAAGADNTADLTGLRGKIGLTDPWGALSAQDLLTRKFGLYRAFVEIPATSGRDPLTVLDEDYAREIAGFI